MFLADTDLRDLSMPSSHIIPEETCQIPFYLWIKGNLLQIHGYTLDYIHNPDTWLEMLENQDSSGQIMCAFSGVDGASFTSRFQLGPWPPWFQQKA